MQEKAVIFENVEKYYGSFCALKKISFFIPANSIVGLIGSNGSGKTTSLRCLLNYYTDYKGKITLFDKDAKKMVQEESILSYIPEKPVYYEELTLKEHFQFIGSMYDTKNRIDGLIERLELAGHLQKFPHELSKGTLQKLLIGCALLRHYDLLIADEPFSGLDPRQIYELRQKFINLKNEGKTIIVSTHLLSLIEEMCDYFIMIDGGFIIGEGKLEDILQKAPNCKNLEELYLMLAGGGNII